MYAIVKTGGKQYKAEAGKFIDIEKLDAEVGAEVSFEALMVVDGETVTVGTPVVDGVKVVGKVSFYETGNSYQITDLKLKLREPENPDNLVLISEGNEIPYTELTADAFTSKVERTAVVDGEEVLRECDYAELLLATSVSMKGLVVESIYTTTNEASSSKGAMTLTCKVGDKTVDVRTEVLKDAEGNVITAEYFEGKTIDVRGVVDRFDGTYQIKVFTMNDITVN